MTHKMEFTRKELQGMELALHYVDGDGGINKSTKQLWKPITSAHKKIMKKLDLMKKGWG